MRLLTLCFLASAFLLPAQTADEKDAVSAAQKLFDAMAAHDADALRAVMLPDARLYSIRANAAPASTAGADFATQIAALKFPIVERFTAAPRVLIRAGMAQVWGEYEFLRDGKFGHCGVDSFTLFKTEAGWKIASIAYTTETTGCSNGH
jgi:hypothetical protein